MIPNTLIPFLVHFIKKHWISFLFIQIFATALTIDNVVWPQLIRMIIEIFANYTGPKNEIWGAVSGMILLGALVWVVTEVFFRAAGILSMKVMPRFEASIRMTFFEHMTRQSHTFFANNFAGSVGNKINDIARSASSALTLLMTLFVPVLLTFIISTSMFAAIYPLFGVMIMVWIILHIGICIVTARKSQEMSEIHAESRSALTGTIIDSFVNNINMRIFARSKYELEYIGKYQQIEMEKHKASLWYVEKVRIFLGLLCFLFMGVFLTWLQIYTYKIGILKLSDLVFTFQASFHVVMSAWWAGMELPRFFAELGVCQQSLKLLVAPIEIKDKPNAKPIVVTNGKIKFENVTFRYNKNENIFEDKNVMIKPGEKVGLVGFSGSGKTTFINLLLRYFDLDKGRILIDGQDISQVTQDSLHENIAFIPQEPILFHRTLMENIRYGNVNATDEDVIAAAKHAHCHEFIVEMEDGYESIVGERGSKLSGGQKQRIAIARAVLKKAPIIIMDEATSALDSETENKIQESIEVIMKGKTAIVIAHRLATLMDMDRILVFKDGDVVEEGTHESLLEMEGGYYANLWNLQSDGFLPDNEG